MKSTKRGIPRIVNAFKYSYDGFISAFKSEEALRQDILVFVIFTIIALFLPICFFQQAIFLYLYKVHCYILNKRKVQI